MKSILFAAVIATTFFTNAQSKDVYVEVTFKSGTLSGTHKFTPEKRNYMSQVNIKFFEEESNLNASKLVSEKGIQLHYISRTFLGEATKGNHKAKVSTTGCGSLNFIDLKLAKAYNRVDGVFKSCEKVAIQSVTDWEKGLVKRRRIIEGNFTDTLEFEFTMDDGNKKTEIVEVSIKFRANESRMN